MRTSRNQLRAAALVAVACSGGALAAAPANAASTPQQDKLIAQLQKNANLLLSPLFLLQAQAAKLNIPATLRLQRAVNKTGGTGPSDTRFKLRIPAYVSIGVPQYLETTIYGTQKLEIRPNGLGPLRLTIPAAAGGNGQALGPGLNAAPLAIYKRAGITADTFANGGCSDFPDAVPNYTKPTPDDPKVAPLGLDPGVLANGTNPAAAAWFARGDDSSRIRTAPLSLAVAKAANGTANLVTGALSEFQLTTSFPMYNVVRTDEDGCRQAWTGYTQTTVPVNLGGKLKIAPGMTYDGKARLGTVALATPAGKFTNVTVPVCFAPYKFYTTDPTTPGGPKVRPAPNVQCDADGSALPASEGGSPDYTGGAGGLSVKAEATIESLNGDLLIG